VGLTIIVSGICSIICIMLRSRSLMNSDSEPTARAIRVARATLYRWEKDAEPKSCRPKRTRPKTWTSALVEAVEHVRLDFPMWRRAKLGPPLRTEGFKVSDANQRRSVGRA